MKRTLDKKYHCMIDLEATARAETAAIPSLGAVIFDLHDEGDSVESEFIEYISIKDQIRNCGRTVDDSTMQFWNDRSKVTQEVYDKQFSGTKDFKQALIDFAQWQNQYNIEFFWVYNISYDYPKLASAFEYFNLDAEFIKQYWKWNCAASIIRTIAMIAEEPSISYKLKNKYVKKYGDAHDPMTDCKIQVEMLKDCIIR